MRRTLAAARALAGLVAAATIVGGPSGTAQAQTAPKLGALQGKALASGIAVAYRPEGLLPIASPVDLSSPDALATITSGPSTFARASAADPGDLLANPGALLALASSDYQPGTVPPYPYRVSATSGVGEPSAESNPAPGLNARVDAEANGSSAQSTMPALAAPAVATAGSISSNATTATDGSTVTVHARVEVSNFNLLGILTIDSIVSDVTATSDGTTTNLTGNTIATGAAVAGQPVTIDASGVHSGPTPQDAKPLLGPVVGSGGGSVDQILSNAGIHVTLAGPVAQDGTTTGQLTAAGLHIEIEVSNQTIPVLAQIPGLVPPTDAPGVEDLLVVSQTRHLQYIDVARGYVSLTALAATPRSVVAPVAPSKSATPVASASSLVGATPAAAPAPAASGRAVAVPAAVQRPEATLATGIGALVLIALLVQPFAGGLLKRLADTVLAPGATEACPREER